MVLLQPSESLKFRMLFYKKSGEGEEPQSFHLEGEYPVRIRLQFAPPHAGDQEIRTEAVIAHEILAIGKLKLSA